MEQKLILTEWYDLTIDQNLLSENIDNGGIGQFVLKNQLLQKANVKNHNGRVYPPDILKREVTKYSKLVNDRSAFGELDHPDSPVVQLKNVALLISEIYMNEHGEVRGDIEILNTPNGQILKSLMKQKVKLGISSRGLGTLQSEGDTEVVQNDFELIAFDAVSSPSTPGAYLVTEAKSFAIDKYNNVREITHSILKDDYFKNN